MTYVPAGVPCAWGGGGGVIAEPPPQEAQNETRSTASATANFHEGFSAVEALRAMVVQNITAAKIKEAPSIIHVAGPEKGMVIRPVAGRAVVWILRFTLALLIPSNVRELGDTVHVEFAGAPLHVHITV